MIAAEKRRPRSYVKEIIMFAIGLVWVIPFVYPLMISLKPTKEVYKDVLALPTYLDFSNYSVAWSKGNLGNALFNTAVITVTTVVLLILLGSLCAYTIARKSGRRWGLVYTMFVVGVILPYKLGLLPTYVVFNNLGLTGKFAGIILLQTGIQMPMAVFLYTGFARTIPRTFEEAAQIDGASTFMLYRLIVFPLLKPVTATVMIQTGIAVWNEFYMSLIFLGGSKRLPLSVSLYSYVGDNATQWNLVFASVVVSLIPAVIFYLLAQKNMIKGFAGGIKE